MSYHDVNTGLPSLILACEMPLFMILMLFAFPVTPYRNQGGPAAGMLTAIVEAFNISDLLSAFVRGPMRLVREQQREILRQGSERVEGMGIGSRVGYEEDSEGGKRRAQKGGRGSNVV